MKKRLGHAYDRFLYASQLSNTTVLIRYFLACISFIGIYIYYLAYNFYSSIHHFNIWFALTVAFLATNIFVIPYLFKTHKLNYNYINSWISTTCFLTGVLIASGISLLYYHLPELPIGFDTFEAISLGTTLSFVSILFSIIFLSQRLHYFIFFFIPSISPYLIVQLFLAPNQYEFYFSTSNFAVAMLFTCAILCMQLQRHLVKINFENKQLIKITESQLKSTKQKNSQLHNEMQFSKEMSEELQKYSHSLEEKIHDRTNDLAKIHYDLKNKQENLVLAHEIAGLIPWDWNIAERKITFTDKQNNTTLKDADVHRAKLMSLIHPEDVQHFKAMLRKHLRGHSERFEATYRIKRYDDNWYWVHDIGRVIERDLNNHLPLHMVGIRRDIHQERLNQERLNLTVTALEQAEEGIIILDQNFRYVSINPYFENMIGRKKEQIIGQHIFDFSENFKTQQQATHNRILTDVLQHGRADGEITEHFLSGKKLTMRYSINAVKNEKNKTINYIGIISDLSDQKLQEQRLSYLQNYDTLTDLPNRLYYNYQLHQYLVSQNDSIQKLAIIRLNIDRFRPLNEYLNHNGGDAILRQFAQRLRLTVPEAFIVAHLNSDNFAIVYELSHIRPNIEEQCELLSKACTAPFIVNNEEFILTVSMGVSIYPDHGRQVDYLNNCAEQALLDAKKLGGNTVKTYSLESNQIIEQNVVLERELRNAIQNDEFEIYFQPKVNFYNRAIHGFEALIRWNHPTKGVISPNIFIPLAEQTSLISELGSIVINKTAQQVYKWNKLGFDKIRVSFNVAAQQLHRGNLVDILDDALETYNISGQSLELELTESSLLEKSCTVKTILHQLKERGIHISLDDFGTGYSSLSYLTDFPIDTLKIDRSFVNRIGQSKQEAIISAIVAMGKAMGMTIVAEGIETTEQLKFLEKLNCDLAQGYLFSKPLPEQDATIYLKNNKPANNHNYLI